LFWERGGNKAVREGKWKYVSAFPENKDELYDIESDRAENNNVADKYPEIVAGLKAKYADWAKKNDVVDYNKLRPKVVNQLNSQSQKRDIF